MSLSEGVLRACDFFYLKVPENFNGDFPSDCFGENLELNLDILRRASHLNKKDFSKIYGKFKEKFSSQIPLKRNSANLNIYFCDYVLNSMKNHADVEDYFDFEFYRKSSDEQKTFIMQFHRVQTRVLCNDFAACEFLDNKVMAIEKFADFVHRDWLDSQNCSLEDLKNFVEKNPRFFTKPIIGSYGRDAAIITVNENVNLERLLNWIVNRKCIVEGVINQHESLKEFCPDTLNTIRVNTLCDVHGVVHILTAGGRFGRVGKIVDNFHGGGFSTIIDPETGIIISDGINKSHKRSAFHPDTKKVFKGFQYPFWDKVRDTVIKMAKVIPQLNHVGWDIAINSDCEIELVEANCNPDVDVQQAPDSVGRIYLYKSLIEEWQEYKNLQMKFLGYRINNLKDFKSAYENPSFRLNSRMKFLFEKLAEDCRSIIDVGCREKKFIGTLCAKNIKYIPIDFIRYDEEILACDLNKNFPDIKADACICAFTAEYIENLPRFFENICNAAQKQILMLCRPIDKEIYKATRWKNPVLNDFTEEFLITSMKKNNFRLQSLTVEIDNSSIIAYDFRKII